MRTERLLGVKAHVRSIFTVLPAHTSTRVGVGFTPRNNIPQSSVIVIRYKNLNVKLNHCVFVFFYGPISTCRNNLTMMELVTVVGTGQTGDVTFDNKRIDSTLMFEVTDKNCESMTSRIFKLLVYKLAVHYVLLSLQNGRRQRRRCPTSL